ncbi:MAG: TlpA family protein disulfide reductase [Euzebyales bacterium]|nr:TlpA family protein disulfide reductase [Euzebyales bacterium]
METNPQPRLGSPLRTTFGVGLAVAAAFVVGAVATTMIDAEDGPPSSGATSTAQAVTPVPLVSRMPATARAPLPETTLDGFAGAGAVALSDYRGDPLILNFWASWCAPCVEEMPDFQAFAVAHADEVPVLGVNVKDAPSNAEAFTTELGITYDLAVDPDGDLFTAVEAFAMPTTLFVDAEGAIVYRHAGFLDGRGLADLAAQHLGVDSNDG